MSVLPLGMTDAQSYRVIVEGVRALAGHQVITFGDAWTVLTGLKPDDMDREEARFLRWLLDELGYEPQWVTEPGRTTFLRRWIRDIWAIDFNANLNRPIKVYVPH
ncbi:hypothetical protein [Erythrobacter donghaensis]|uniref:hypothetical protein n=1 Tax=Erythrobacter donghaensis TaxID=267135 RepID=UPI0013023D8E|nr:hypothetical protein [Erythrobacter donghaensis]